MDRSLDEIISERPQRGGPRRNEGRGGPPPRAPRNEQREEYPRDGVRKYRAPDRTNIDTDWVHDRFEDDRYDRSRRGPADDSRYAPSDRALEASGTKLRVDNIHYELTEEDLRELFERIGPTTSVRLLYDRMDRSQGTAFVTYTSARDAKDAMREYDGQNANGQAIRITIMPSAPANPRGGSLFDRIERPPRSLFERIEGGEAVSRADSREDGGRRRRERSDSPRKGRLNVPDNVDRYVPGQRTSRSPARGGRGTPRESGRRPGARREEGGRGGRRGRTDEEGRPLVGGRPRKTAEELDAEMADYWGNKPADGAAANGNGNGAAAPSNAVADADVDMVE